MKGVQSNMQPLQSEKRYTYADYEKWDDEKRYELIDGAIHVMEPGPGQAHQEISGELSRQLGNFLRGKPQKVFHAPFDVCLNAKGDNDYTVVQPDLLVVCDLTKLDGKRCDGAPDMAVEILSPSTQGKDRLLKFNKYMEAGVREYWIIDPKDEIISVNILKNGEYVTKMYGNTGSIPVHVLEGCIISIDDLFG
jgi:Uma2 family endonuclease